MPLDATRYQIEIAAADKTAAAFASVDRRVRQIEQQTRRLNQSMAAGGVGAGKAARDIGSMGAGAMLASRGVGALGGGIARLAPALAPAAAAWYVFNAGMKAGALVDQAEQLGVSMEALQAYRLVALQAGVGTEQLDGALQRLTGAAGAAAGGSDEMIARFDKLGVKLLDSEKNLRPIEDLLPEVARGLLEVGNVTERTALAQELFGRAGSRVLSMLPQLAAGTDQLTAATRRQGMMVERDAAEAWNKLETQLKVTKTTADTALAALAAPIATVALEAVNKILTSILSNLDRLKREAATAPQQTAQRAAENDVKHLEDQLAAARQRQSQFREGSTGFKLEQGGVTGLEKRIADARRAEQAARQATMESEEEAARRHKLPGMSPPPTTGALSPTGKSAGGSDPYAKAIENAREYVALKNAETSAIGLNVREAARLRHEQELVNKASTDSNRLAPAQIANIKALAAAMAEADARNAGGTFMHDLTTKAKEFIAQQQLERETLYMSEQAALAYRLEQEAINRAKAEGVVLTPQYVEQIKQLAAAQSQAADQTRKAREWAEFERERFKSFFSELRSDLMQGASLWQSLGDAGLSALDKISGKLLDMALNDLWSAAFPGGGGAGGGIAGLFGGLFGGGGAGGTGAGMLDGLFTSLMGSPFGFAGGGTPPVGTPYLVGERGPEVRVDGRPGHIFNRQQWNGLDGGGGQQPVTVYVTGDTDLVRVAAEGAAVRVVNGAAPGIIRTATGISRDQVMPTVNRHRSDRGGDYRNG